VTLWAKQGNTVGRVTIADLRATSVYRAAISVESWADEPIDHVTLRGLDVEFAGGGEAKLAKEPVKGPGVDARVLPAWGVYARNVSLLTMEGCAPATHERRRSTGGVRRSRRTPDAGGSIRAADRRCGRADRYDG
jgi:hypothetical protein